MRTSTTPAFAEAIQTLQAKFPNASHNWCYGQAARIHKDLFLAARIEVAGNFTEPGLPQSADDAEIDPAARWQVEAFGMYGCTDEAELRSAFLANHGKWWPVWWDRVFAGLARLYVSEARQADSLLVAVRKLREKYPALYSKVKGWYIPCPPSINPSPETKTCGREAAF